VGQGVFTCSDALASVRSVSSLVTISDDFCRAVAERVSTLVLESLTQPTGWLTVADAATYLATSKDAIRGHVKRAQIPCHRGAAGRILFDRAELDAWVRGDLQP
jgi:excisionase family DNA binding protein